MNLLTGDAPADVLAAKYAATKLGSTSGLEIGMIAVATGKFSSRELQEVIDRPVDVDIEMGKGKDWTWDPIVLEKGLGDARFIDYCKIRET